MTTVSVVVPMYNETDALPLLVARLRPVLDGLGRTYEVIAVDDGSTDATPVLLQRFRREWPQLRVLRLRANAGHQSALSAGLAAARGQWCVSIDADLQDPPEVIADMLEVAENKQVDVVYGVRSDRSTDTTFKRVTASAFYRLMSRLAEASGPHGAGDFRLMSRATVDAINGLPARHRVLRLVVPALGFPSATVSYRREARAAGQSKYPLSRMLRLTLDSLTGFSIAPLRMATWFGLIGGLAAIGLLFYALVAQFTGSTVAGWTSTVVAVSAVGAVQLLCLGVLGEYVGRMYSQMQGRPSYFVAYDSLDDDTRLAVDGAAHRERADHARVDQALADQVPADQRLADQRLADQARLAETSSDTPGSRSTGR
ncbi:MAG TPA: glycosyltransferase family 2 protein [Actinomycetales bacterium]|nr:glycosyltransferase family 2 protein [Actinomycetales bacterium]